MENDTQELLKSSFSISPYVLEFVLNAEKAIAEKYCLIDEVSAYNHYKVLSAFQKNHVSDSHFAWTTGYGYNDSGKKVLSKVFADVFRTEDALVRPIIVSGTHALALTMSGILRPGDEIIFCTGSPYDTLHDVVGIRGQGMGSLLEFGITYKQVDLLENGAIDFESITRSLTDSSKLVFIQRSTGYAWRNALTIGDIRECVNVVKGINPNIVCMVDNCYGEFIEKEEPTDAGADIIAGSLIKNPGGGLALAGGYIAGRADLVRQVSYRMTCPGIGDECGLTFGQTRSILQGLFLAPITVAAALKGAVLCARVFSDLGYEVSPCPGAIRSDIIQLVRLNSQEAVMAFCEGVQAAAPIDAYVKPTPSLMPGYDDEVIMAAGAFVQGSSIELSADGPMRAPYIVCFQGGITYEHAKLGVMKALQTLYDRNLMV